MISTNLASPRMHLLAGDLGLTSESLFTHLKIVMEYGHVPISLTAQRRLSRTSRSSHFEQPDAPYQSIRRRFVHSGSGMAGGADRSEGDRR
jgi:hypothetical protein